MTDTRRSRASIIVSAHLDDAVFSAWHVLTARPDTHVVTVFAGIPPADTLTPLDRRHGASDSASWMRRRRNEDALVIATAGATGTHLDLLDVQYRVHDVSHLRARLEADPARLFEITAGEPAVEVDQATIGAALAPHLPRDVTVYAPMGIGDHPDHVAVARWAVDYARTGADVCLYADSPYFLRDGLPSLVTGAPAGAADTRIRRAASRLELDLDEGRPQVAVLDEHDAARKVDATKAYTTEHRWIVADFGVGATDAGALSHEIVWPLEVGGRRAN